jgi:putative addiction module component (TIGR02574 family)
MTVAEIITAAKQLDLEDRMHVVRELQETLPADEEPITLSPEWMTEIQRRADELKAHPERAIPWEEARERIRAKIGSHVDY